MNMINKLKKRNNDSIGVLGSGLMGHGIAYAAAISGFKVLMLDLTKNQAEMFYEVHKERTFFNSLVEYMTSGPVQVQVLEGEDAVAKYRKIMGATNPAEAEEGTIRKLFAESIEANSVHGSDSEENAKIEIQFFFPNTIFDISSISSFGIIN